jgi:glucose/mannose transport system substrate-binding protein
MLKLVLPALLSLVSPLAAAQDAEPAPFELYHWWGSAGERDAVTALRRYVEQLGVRWAESGRVQQGNLIGYRQTLAQRIEQGDGPDAAVVLSTDVRQLMNSNALLLLDDVAAANDWDEVVPTAVQRLSRVEGHWVSIPINIHSTNWIWLNAELAHQLDLPVLDTWDDLIVALEKARQAGLVPLAIGDEAGQHMLLFEAVSAGVGGAEFYRRVFLQLKPTEPDLELLKVVFARMRELRDYTQNAGVGLRWNEATAMVRTGQALVQLQGGWAIAEFNHFGLFEGQDYYCQRFPDTQGMVLFNSDQIVVFRNQRTSDSVRAAFATALMSPEVQRELNITKGAAPARVDALADGLSGCGRKAIHDVRMGNMRGTLLESIAMSGASPMSVSHAFYPVVSGHFRGEISDQQALNALETVWVNQ